MRRLIATEAARRFSDLLDAVEHERATFAITRNGQEVARIGPAGVPNGAAVRSLLGSYGPDLEWAHEIAATRALLTIEKPIWPD
jgi:prevent-host-death family protein